MSFDESAVRRVVVSILFRHNTFKTESLNPFLLTRETTASVACLAVLSFRPFMPASEYSRLPRWLHNSRFRLLYSDRGFDTFFVQFNFSTFLPRILWNAVPPLSRCIHNTYILVYTFVSFFWSKTRCGLVKNTVIVIVRLTL